jgi:predicted phosphodiesterase
MRIFALSDVHADHPANAAWLGALSATDYQSDTLILAGDVSDDLETLIRVLDALQAKFARVLFVPGNHELWVRREEAADSIAKFRRVLAVCREAGVDIEPVRHGRGDDCAWIVPLFGWYATPEEGADSLYLPAPGPDRGLRGWRDVRFTRWTPLDGHSPAEHFVALNEPWITRTYDAPVITCSHFLPRQELMFRDGAWPGPAPVHGAPAGDWRPSAPARPARTPRWFNFSRVAGSRALERQLRRLGAITHVYGHQHRNRRRVLAGVCYVSHCLGTSRERRTGRVGHVGDAPVQVWPMASPGG